MEINDEIELRILNTALIQARFYSNNYDYKDYYGSPFMGAIHEKIINELRTKSFNGKLLYYPDENSLLIESYRDSSIWIENVKKHITNIDNWGEISIEIKKSTICNFIYPFILSKETIDELCLCNI